MPEITEADRRAADSWASGIFGQQSLPAAFATHRELGQRQGSEATEAAIVAWLLDDGTRLDYEASGPENGREHPLWWASDQIAAGAHRG